MTAAAMHATEFIIALADAGIIGNKEVHRVIIDAQCGEVVRIYVEHFGTEKLLEIIMPFNFENAEVTILE